MAVFLVYRRRGIGKETHNAGFYRPLRYQIVDVMENVPCLSSLCLSESLFFFERQEHNLFSLSLLSLCIRTLSRWMKIGWSGRVPRLKRSGKEKREWKRKRVAAPDCWTYVHSASLRRINELQLSKCEATKKERVEQRAGWRCRIGRSKTPSFPTRSLIFQSDISIRWTTRPRAPAHRAGASMGGWWAS